MRNYFLIITGLVFMLSFNSCRSTKDINILQDLSHNEMLKGIPTQAPEYLIEPNDNLFVEIMSINPEVNQLFSPSRGSGYQASTEQMYGQLSSQYLNGYQVDNQGMILLPLLGKISVVGMTIEKAQEIIQKKSLEYVKDATVKVKLLSYKVTVGGEVKNPGIYYNYNKSINIFEALNMANGFTDYANVRKVLIVRTVQDGTKSIRVDLAQKAMMESEAYYLQPNDILYVEADKFKSFNLNVTAWTMFLSAITTALLVYEVFQP
jgi:polysaccharide biosynthesis/export protein